MNQQVQKCGYCGKVGEPLVRDHVVPRSRGGSDNAVNIVMACAACNSSKSDKTPTEWLGDRVPAHIAEIESKVDRALKARFKRRDKKIGQKEFAFSLDDGKLGEIGEVIRRDRQFVEIEILNSMMFVCGVWWIDGEIKIVPIGKCRLFNDRTACMEEAHDLMRSFDK